MDEHHPRPASGAARWLRGALLALSALVVSVAGHVLGGGSVHVSGGLVLGGLVLAGICVAIAESRRDLPTVLVTVLLAQPAFHLLASLGGHGHTGHGRSTAPALAVLEPTAAGFLDVTMLAGHLVGAVLVSVVLAEGERVWWTLRSLAWRLVLRPWYPPRPVPAATVLHPRHEPRPMRLAWAGHHVPFRRGPPVGLPAH